MPKVPKPDKTPESISPTLWQNVNRRDILSFLDDHSGSYLFYKVMGNDPNPDNSRNEAFNAASVDEIFAMQKAQYIAQAASMHLDKSTGSPVKKASEPVWRPWKRHVKPWIKIPESKAAGHWRSSSGRSRPQPRRNQMRSACPRSSTICAFISNAATCRNKKRAEGGDPGGGGSDTKNGRGCHACGCKDHFVKDCPLVVKARALQTSTTENTATATVSAENKSSAGVPSNYSSSPQKRNSTASALMTTALLASTAAPCTPMVAHFDSAATAHMGPDVRFLRNAKPSNVGIEVYNNEVVTNNMEGVFVSHSAEGNLPDGQRGYTNPSLPTTLISGPQVVFEHPKQDVVLSEQHGSFMQPTSTKCPICRKRRADREIRR